MKTGRRPQSSLVTRTAHPGPFEGAETVEPAEKAMNSI